MILDLVLGVVMGVILAATGAGGGILAVPLLVFAKGMTVAAAAPIGLMALAVSSSFASVFCLRKQSVRYRAALFIAATGMLIFPLGLWVAHRSNNQWLSIVYSATLLFVAYCTLRKGGGSHAQSGDRPPQCMINAASGRFIWNSRCVRFLAASGTVAGFLSGLLGVGGGFVIVPALTRYTHLAMHSIVATTIAVIALISIMGVLSIVHSVPVNWEVALPFVGGAVSGVVAGKGLPYRIPEAVIQNGFGLLAAFVAIAMLLRGVWPG